MKPQLHKLNSNPKRQRSQPSATMRSPRSHSSIKRTSLLICFSLLLLVTHAQTQRESLIISTTDEGGDVLLRRRRRKQPASTLDSNNNQEGGDEWIAYDFKPAIPPYSKQRMEELLLIHDRQSAITNDVDDDVEEAAAAAAQNNNTTKNEETEADDVVHEIEEGDQIIIVSDLGNNEEESVIADEQQDEVGVESTLPEDTAEHHTDMQHEDSQDEEEGIVADDVDDTIVKNDATKLDESDDASENSDSDKDNSDDDDVAKDVEEKEDEAVNTTPVDDTDAQPYGSDDGVTLEEGSTDGETVADDNITSTNVETEHQDDNDDVMPAAEPHKTVAPPVGPLPDPDADDDLDLSENESSEDDKEPSLESESAEEVDEQDDILHQETNLKDASESILDVSVEGINEEPATATDEDDEDGEREEGNVHQAVELEDDTNSIIVEDDAAPPLINEGEPSPETIQNSTEDSLPGTTTSVDEEKINIQYDDPLPPTFSPSPPSSNNKDANREFVTGLDDVDKLFESVEVPDELDVGADGSSMQDVLVGQALKIIMKKAKSVGGAIKVKFDKVAMPVKNALPQLGLFLSDDDEDESEIDAIFESLVSSNEKMVTPNLEEEEDSGSELSQKLQQFKQQVKDLPLVKSEEAQKVFRFTKEKWEQGKHLFDDLLSIFEGDDDDEDGDFDLSNINLDDIQSLVR